MEVLSGPDRRRSWPDETKIAIVTEALAPGAVVSEVARRHDVVPSQLFGWIRRFREEVTAVAQVPLFVPAVMEGVPAEQAAPSISPAPIEISIGPATVRLRGPVDSRALAAVLKALKVLA
jgi:transposase